MLLIDKEWHNIIKLEKLSINPIYIYIYMRFKDIFFKSDAFKIYNLFYINWKRITLQFAKS